MKALIPPFVLGGIVAAMFSVAVLTAQEQRIDFTQTPTVATGAATPVAEMSSTSVETTARVYGHHRATLQLLREAVAQSDLDAQKKRMVLRKLRRPLVALRATDLITSKSLDQAVIDFDEEGYGVDWDSLLNFIKEIMPLILQLIDLFG